MTIALCIALYNQARQLSWLLDCVERQSRSPDQIILADDGSSDDVRSAIERSSLAGKLTWVRQVDRGFRKTRILNAALRNCHCDRIIFIDSDCLPERHFVADHLRYLQRGHLLQGHRAHISEASLQWVQAPAWMRPLGLLAGAIRGWRACLRTPWPTVTDSVDPTGWSQGCNMSFWTSDLFEINGFDERYAGWGWGEDSDICARAILHGVNRRYLRQRALVFHLDHPETVRAASEANLARFRAVLHAAATRCQAGLLTDQDQADLPWVEWPRSTTVSRA